MFAADGNHLLQPGAEGTAGLADVSRVEPGLSSSRLAIFVLGCSRRSIFLLDSSTKAGFILSSRWRRRMAIFVLCGFRRRRRMASFSSSRWVRWGTSCTSKWAS